MPSVSVNAYDSTGQVYSATTDYTGKYCLTIPTARYPVRVEFVNATKPSSPQGTNSISNVQFITLPSASVDFGVVDLQYYCQDNPWVMTPCYVFGDPLPTAAPSRDALVRVRYKTSGVMIGEQPIASSKEVGAVWGLAYKKQSGHLFAAATLRRHSGSGPQGLGGIYVIDIHSSSQPINSTGNVLDSWSIVDRLGIAVAGAAPFTGTGAASNTARGLQTNPTSPSHDTQAFAGVGKVGIGDIDLTDDGNSLFFVNHYDQKLYSIDISQYNPADINTRPTSQTVLSKSIPGACTGGEWRPSGVKIRDGFAFVGGVCDGINGTRSDLRAKVFSINISNSNWPQQTWNAILNFPLTYPKGYSVLSLSGQAGAISTRIWHKWTDNFADLQKDSIRQIGYSVPMLTDLEFDIDGSMIIGFNDRTGFQTGLNNYSPNVNDLLSYSGYAGGDILRAGYSNGKYVLENAGKSLGIIGYSSTNGEGPGFGEFYDDNFFVITCGSLTLRSDF